MKDLILETKKIDWRKLKPYQPENFKKTTPALMAKLKNSIVKNGLSAPFYVWKKGKELFIIDGHHRLDALKELEIEGKAIAQASATYLNIKNDTEAKKIILAFNSHYAKITQGGFDDFIADLDIKEIEMSFEPFNLNWKFDQTIIPEDNEDVVPDVKKPTAQTGDVYEITSPKGVVHRLVCGDSTNENDVKMVMGGGDKFNMCITSPPYNASFINQKGNKETYTKYIQNKDNLENDVYADFLIKSVESCIKVSDTTFYNMQILSGNKIAFIDMMAAHKHAFKDIIYWVKPSGSPQISPGVMNSRCEVILCFSGNENSSKKFKDATFNQGTLWNVIELSVSKNTYSEVHKAVYPVALPEIIIKNFSKVGATVYDPFSGTGSTLIACEKTGRAFRGIEIDPYYIDIILARVKQFSPECIIKKV